jgi:hypothetical protein
MEIIKAGEIVLGVPDTVGGYRLLGRFRLADGTTVTPTFQGLQPPTISIGEQGRDTQPFASSVIYDDLEGGIGVLYAGQRTGNNRFWWANCDLRRRDQAHLLRRKVDKGKPSGVTTEIPIAGGVYNGRVWVAWNHRVRQWQDATGWTDGAATGDRLLTGALAPTTNPVEWEGGWFWPLGTGGFDYWNGAAWVHVAKPVVGFVAYAGSLWGVDGVGQVWSTNLGASACAAKIAAGTFGAADLTDRVRVADRAQGMLLFTTADASADVVPYVVGYRQMYQIDPASYVAQPSGPQLAPHRFPMRATVLGSDNAAYLAQGLGVTQWTGDLATPVGLDLDDGVPPAYRGGVVALANGTLSLYALLDATRAETPVDMTLFGSDPSMAGVLAGTAGLSCLLSREPAGWHVRAVADAEGSGATMLFVEAAETDYRVWFAWAGVCYAISLEQGYLNPLQDQAAEYEPAGTIYYSITDFSFKEMGKVALMAELRTMQCSADYNVGVQPYVQYDAGGAWYPLPNADGTWGIFTDGRHQFLLGQNPGDYDPAHLEAPPVGRRNDYMELRLDLWRGDADLHLTPVVIFAGLHALKVTRPLTGWQFTLDIGRGYNNKTPWQQRDLLVQLLEANNAALIHFAYLPAVDGPPGAPAVRSVKMLRFTGLEQNALAKDFRARINVQLSEVIISREGRS